MNTGKRITELREATEISGESIYPVEMGDGTGTKGVKHKTLVEQMRKDMGLSYEETIALLNEETEGNGNQNTDTESEEL